MATIKNLIATDGNETIIWNTELGHLEIGEDESKQLLLLTSRPYFAVKDIKFNPFRNLLALIGDNGITIVEMPRKWGNKYKSNQDNQVYCKTYNLNQRVFKCEKRIRILHAAWDPHVHDSKQIICILTNDNRLRFHDALADVELQKIYLKVQNDYDQDSGEDDITLGVSMLDLEESAVCFDFGPPLVAQEPDILWPIYILMGTGDILLIYVNHRNSIYAEHIIGPLTMSPQAEDSYGADACSLIVLDSSPPLLAIATPNGVIYHCFAIADKKDLLPQQTLYVYEAIEISKDLIENPDDPYDPHPMKLYKDPTSEIRYFCVHENGVHTVVLPILESIQTECDIAQEKESFSEFLICTRTTTPTETNDSLGDLSIPRGLGLEIRRSNIVLLVLMPNNELITQRISPATTLINRKRFPRPSKNSSRESSEQEVLNSSQIDASRADFQDQIQQILKRKTSVPMLKLSESLEQSNQMAELVEKTVETFQTEYLKRFELAADAIEKKLGILQVDMKNQKTEFSKISRQKDEVNMSVINLSSIADKACQKQKELLSRIDQVLSAVAYGHPDLSEAESKLRRELTLLNNKVRDCRDQLDSIENKHKYHMNQKNPITNTPCDIISPIQLTGIKETLAKQGADIVELKKFVKTSKQKLNGTAGDNDFS